MSLSANKNISLITALGFLIGMCCGFQYSLRAETLVLKTGNVVRGRMLAMDADSITLEVFGVPQKYSLTAVSSIDGKTVDAPAPITQTPGSEITSKTSERVKPISKEPFESPVTVTPQKTLSVKEAVVKEETPSLPEDNAQTLEAIKKIKEKAPSEALSYFEIGYLHRSLGEDEEAFKSYKKALEFDPDLGQKFFNQALDDFYLERHADARDKFLRARELFEVQEDRRMINLVNQQIRKLYNDPDDEIF